MDKLDSSPSISGGMPISPVPSAPAKTEFPTAPLSPAEITSSMVQTVTQKSSPVVVFHKRTATTDASNKGQAIVKQAQTMASSATSRPKPTVSTSSRNIGEASRKSSSEGSVSKADRLLGKAEVETKADRLLGRSEGHSPLSTDDMDKIIKDLAQPRAKNIFKKDNYSRVVEPALKEYKTACETGVNRLQANYKLQETLKEYADIASEKERGSLGQKRDLALGSLAIDLRAEAEKHFKQIATVSKSEVSGNIPEMSSQLYTQFSKIGNGEGRYNALVSTDAGKQIASELFKFREAADSFQFVEMSKLYLKAQAGRLSPDDHALLNNLLKDVAEGIKEKKAQYEKLKAKGFEDPKMEKMYPQAESIAPKLNRLKNPELNTAENAEAKKQLLREVIQELFLNGNDDSLFPMNLSSKQMSDVNTAKTSSNPAAFTDGLKIWQNDVQKKVLVTDIFTKDQTTQFFNTKLSDTQKADFLSAMAPYIASEKSKPKS